jgi:hypothetical protein
MKDNLGSDLFLLAHVDVEKVRFTKGTELGIEFTNEIDAWEKMAFKFRNSRSSDLKYVRAELRPLVYSMRASIE